LKGESELKEYSEFLRFAGKKSLPRDLKPEKVLANNNARPLVRDFGAVCYAAGHQTHPIL
jgi:hypothetical protein